EHGARETAVAIALVAAGDRGPQVPVVGPANADLLLGDAGDRAELGRGVPALGEERLPVAPAGVEELLEVAALELLLRVPGELGRGLVGLDDHAVGVHPKHGVG